MLSAALWLLLWFAPSWIAFAAGVLLAHRIGVLLHEYLHGIPLFNLNRHVHHHEDMRCPWYLLTYRTPEPLSTRHYFTHWFRVYVQRDFVLMRPMSASDLRQPEVLEV